MPNNFTNSYKHLYNVEKSRHAFSIEETIKSEILKVHHNDILAETKSLLWKSDWHSHTWCEIVVLFSGEEQILFEDHPDIIMKAHDICIIPEKTKHSCQPISEVQKRMSILVSVQTLKANAANRPNKQLLNFVLNDSINKNKKVIQLKRVADLYDDICSVLTIVQSSTPFNGILFKHQILLFVLKCFDIIYNKNTPAPLAHQFDTSLFIHDSTDIRFQKIETFLGKNYADCTLEDLSAFLSLGSRQTSRLVMQHYGMTFKEVINHYRILTAQKLLLEGKKIDFVIEYVGYKSSVGFRKAFKQFSNCTPSEFIERYFIQGLPPPTDLLSFKEKPRYQSISK